MSQDPIIVYTLILNDDTFAHMAIRPLPAKSAEETIAILRDGPIMSDLVEYRLAQLARKGADWEILEITVLSVDQMRSAYPSVPIPRPGNLLAAPEPSGLPPQSPKYQA